MGKGAPSSHKLVSISLDWIEKMARFFLNNQRSLVMQTVVEVFSAMRKKTHITMSRGNWVWICT